MARTLAQDRVVRAASLDAAAVFTALPVPCLLLDRELCIVDANPAFLRTALRDRDELVGRWVFDAFPDAPDDVAASGVRNLRASLDRVLATGRPDTMALQRYPIQLRDGEFEERFWSPVNAPVLAPDGAVVGVLHRVEDVTAWVREREQGAQTHARLRDRAETVEADLWARSRELAEANDRLREALRRQHEVGLALQRAMLPTLAESERMAARYRPGVRSLDVCGDWYDVVELPDGRFGAAVGDVVGQGQEAAAVMGQLRAALSAALQATRHAARALEVLDVRARTLEGALATTAAQVVVDPAARTIEYSLAGHPPPLLVGPHGRVDWLHEAADLPLAVDVELARRPQGQVAFSPGSTLVLYTDGLVERRGETLDRGLVRLVSAVAGHVDQPAGALADAVIDGLVGEDQRDDVALLVVRL